MEKKKVDMSTWKRREHFDFFASMDDPFYGVVANVDFTDCHSEAKADGASFFLYSLHKIMKAVNQIEEFRTRIEENDVVLYDTIHVSPTIGREDGSFGFGYFQYYQDRDEFIRKANIEIERVKSKPGLCVGDWRIGSDLVYFSAVPWITFTGLKHAKSFSKNDSVPRISTGKIFKEGGRIKMPVSLDMHHGLADGFHAGMFYRLLEEMS